MQKTVQWPRAIPAITICLALAGTAFAQPGVVRLMGDPATADGPNQFSNLSYHGGAVMTGTKRIRLIFYGNTNWAQNAYPIVLDWASGYAQAPPSLSNILTEYPQGATPFNALAITASSTAVFYTAATQAGYTHGAALTDTLVQQIIKDAINQGLMPLDDKTLYFVLTSPDVTESASFGAFCVQFCGYHGNFSFSGKDLKYSFTGDASTQCPNGCIAQTASSPNGNIGVDGFLNVMSHEAAETFTDPDVSTGPFGWYDSTTGDEIGDKCNFNFGPVQGGGPGSWNQTWAGRRYLLQQEWQNSLNAGAGGCAQKK